MYYVILINEKHKPKEEVDFTQSHEAFGPFEDLKDADNKVSEIESIMNEDITIVCTSTSY